MNFSPCEYCVRKAGPRFHLPLFSMHLRWDKQWLEQAGVDKATRCLACELLPLHGFSIWIKKWSRNEKNNNKLNFYNKWKLHKVSGLPHCSFRHLSFPNHANKYFTLKEIRRDNVIALVLPNEICHIWHTEYANMTIKNTCDFPLK